MPLKDAGAAEGGRQLLRTQIAGAIEDVIQAQEALARVPVDPVLEARVEIDFADALRRQHLLLDGIRDAVENGGPVGESWRSLESALAVGQMLLADCLAYIDGTLARKHGIAAEVCDLADLLLDDVDRRTPVRWTRFTIMSTAELIGENARIVRLRFPESTVWGLPIALHELGHHVMSRLGTDSLAGQTRRPFGEMLEAAREPAFDGEAELAAMQRWNHLHELLADAFATHSGGPAFALASVFMRFNPHRAAKSTFSHPSDGTRLRAILRGLERQDDGSGVALAVADELLQIWSAGVEAAGGAASQPDPALDERVEEIHDLLDEHLRPARFDGAAQAEALAAKLAHGHPVVSLDSDVRPWHVVNAGWLCRLQTDPDPYDLRELADRAAVACRMALAGR